MRLTLLGLSIFYMMHTAHAETTGNTPIFN